MAAAMMALTDARPPRPEMIWTPLNDHGDVFLCESRSTGEIRCVDGRQGSCSCPGFGHRRWCQHLTDLGLYKAYQRWLRAAYRLLALKADRDARAEPRARSLSDYSEAELKQVFA